MARNAALLAMLAVLLGGCISVHETQRVADQPSGTTYVDTVEVKSPVRVLRHVVLLQFKEGTDAADIRKIENAFNALPSKVGTIYGFEWGTDVSKEGLQKGFTHCFLVTFLSEADRDAYIADPAHQEFGGMLKPYLQDVLVVDYWAN